MNLLKDKWLPVIRRNSGPGEFENIAIWQLLDDYHNNPVTDIIAPRPDFRNAIYQLLIGIVQVVAFPEDEEDWRDLYYSPWSAEEFNTKVLSIESCFEIDSDGPAFMQDYGLVGKIKEETLKYLFINLPSNEHFFPADINAVKSEPKKINPYWAAIALYTLQTFAPGGRRGHRGCMRKGGALTTIILPKKESSTLWGKIWMNVIDEENVRQLNGNIDKKDLPDIFPWMKPTKTSENDSELFPDECNPFHSYFGMPRRIRLKFEDREGKCDLTGLISDKVVIGYLTIPYGNYYNGWIHPLSAYELKKKDKLPKYKKTPEGGPTYRHWLDLTIGSKDAIPAFVVKKSQDLKFRRRVIKNEGAILWVAGYKMVDKRIMKAQCWYDSIMPIFPLEPSISNEISIFVQYLVKAAQDISDSIKLNIKAVWFKPNKKNQKRNYNEYFSFVELSFWHNTESDFYKLIQRLYENFDSPIVKNDIIQNWIKILTYHAYKLFDDNVLKQQEDGNDIGRVIKARKEIKNEIFKIRKYIEKKLSAQ